MGEPSSCRLLSLGYGGSSGANGFWYFLRQKKTCESYPRGLACSTRNPRTCYSRTCRPLNPVRTLAARPVRVAPASAAQPERVMWVPLGSCPIVALGTDRADKRRRPRKHGTSLGFC